MEQSGFPFPAIRQGGLTGPLVYVKDDTKTLVKSSVYQILMTTPGERPWNPEFGCAANNSLFDSPTTATLEAMTSMVYEALLKWEPRIKTYPGNIKVTNVDNAVQVTVAYDIIVPVSSGIRQDSITLLLQSTK